MDWRLYRGWDSGTGPLLALRPLIEYREDRATGWLWLPAGSPVTPWPGLFAELGPQLIAALRVTTGLEFTACCFQAYAGGAGVGWHHDRDWGAQAILSLGVTRTFGLRRVSDTSDTSDSEVFMKLAHGDLLVMPPGFQDSWEHCVPEEDVPGERCSLVFRAGR